MVFDRVVLGQRFNVQTAPIFPTKHRQNDRHSTISHHYKIIFKSSQWGFPGANCKNASFSAFSSACLCLLSSLFFFNFSTSLTTLLRREFCIQNAQCDSLSQNYFLMAHLYCSARRYITFFVNNYIVRRQSMSVIW